VLVLILLEDLDSVVPLVSPLFTDVVQCLGTPLLEIKKSKWFPLKISSTDEQSVVYLFLVSYGRSRPDQIHLVIPNFLQVSRYVYYYI